MNCLHGKPAAYSTTSNGSFWFCNQNPRSMVPESRSIKCLSLYLWNSLGTQGRVKIRPIASPEVSFDKIWNSLTGRRDTLKCVPQHGPGLPFEKCAHLSNSLTGPRDALKCVPQHGPGLPFEKCAHLSNSLTGPRDALKCVPQHGPGVPWHNH